MLRSRVLSSTGEPVDDACCSQLKRSAALRVLKQVRMAERLFRRSGLTVNALLNSPTFLDGRS